MPHHQYWGDGIETAIKVLPYCKGVEYFLCWISQTSVSTRLAEVVTDMRPRKLIIRSKHLLGTPEPNFSLPFFDNVTHMDITDWTEEWSTWSGLHRLPHLSHLLLQVGSNPVTIFSPKAMQVVSDVAGLHNQLFPA
jgi:hypothetical protein